MPRHHRISLLRAAAVIALATCPAWSCRKTGSTETTTTAPIGVTVHVARTETLRDVATASGVIVPSTAADLTIYAPESASILELPKRETDMVAAGDVLVRFDIPSVTQAIAAGEVAVAEARTRAESAAAAFTRITDFYNRGLTARTTYEAARAELSTSDSIHAQAATQLQLTRVEATRAVIHAHFPGRVMKVWHAEGDMVSGGQVDPVLRVVDPTRVQVSVQLPIAQLARIVPGQAATIRAFDSSAPFAATVASKPAITEPNAPTGEVRLTFDQPATLPLDAPVSVEILFDQRTGVIVVPNDAVIKDGDATFVVVAGDDQRAHRRDVRTGLSTRTSTQIAAGLTAGERVIVGGIADVSEGTPITFAQ